MTHGCVMLHASCAHCRSSEREPGSLCARCAPGPRQSRVMSVFWLGVAGWGCGCCAAGWWLWGLEHRLDGLLCRMCGLGYPVGTLSGAQPDGPSCLGHERCSDTAGARPRRPGAPVDARGRSGRRRGHAASLRDIHNEAGLGSCRTVGTAPGRRRKRGRHAVPRGDQGAARGLGRGSRVETPCRRGTQLLARRAQHGTTDRSDRRTLRGRPRSGAATRRRADRGTQWR